MQPAEWQRCGPHLHILEHNLRRQQKRKNRSRVDVVLINHGQTYVLHDKSGTQGCNAMRELAWQMIKPNKYHWKSLERVVGYVLSEPH